MAPAGGAPAAAAAAAAFPAYQADAAAEADQAATPKIHFIYADEAVSMEEKRAEAPRYRYDDSTIREQVSALDKSIGSRLASLAAVRGV